MNQEALVNFGGEQLKKTHDVALAIIHRYYGHAPRRMYFYGNSQEVTRASSLPSAMGPITTASSPFTLPTP